MSLLYGAGRRLPTARFGEARGRVYTLQGLALSRIDRQPLVQLQALINAQMDRGQVWCLRLGRDKEKVYVASGGLDWSTSIAQVTPAVTVTEAFYQEDLRAYDSGLGAIFGAANWRVVT